MLINNADYPRATGKTGKLTINGQMIKLNGRFLSEDLHTHTKFSPDSETEPMDNVRVAEEAGITRLAITDHLDIDEYCKSGLQAEKNLEEYSFEIPKLNESTSVEVLFGIELGNANYDFDTAERLLRKYKFDFVLLSLHALKNERDFYHLPLTKDNVQDYFKRYFNELYEMILWAKRAVKINSLAHLTYPFRYIPANLCSVEQFFAEIDDIFKEIIPAEIALEINTAGLRRENYKQTDPPLFLAERYFSVGGEKITIGSDAHLAKDVGRGIIYAYA
jgi:histidinol-phosphatase (PHP family)